MNLNHERKRTAREKSDQIWSICIARKIPYSLIYRTKPLREVSKRDVKRPNKSEVVFRGTEEHENARSFSARFLLSLLPFSLLSSRSKSYGKLILHGGVLFGAISALMLQPNSRWESLVRELANVRLATFLCRLPPLDSAKEEENRRECV